MSALPLVTLLASALAFAPPAPQSSMSKTVGAPETFNARASVGSTQGRGDAYLSIKVDKYSAEKDVRAMETALKGGSAAFTAALKKAPAVGRVVIGDKTFTIRWARQTATDKGRIVTVVTDAPIYFVGGGLPGAQSREGFDVAVFRLVMDSSGVGEGQVAAAAKVKPGGETGIEIEAYDAEPVTLRSVMRLITS
jgi:hypothetical protein